MRRHDNGAPLRSLGDPRNAARPARYVEMVRHLRSELRAAAKGLEEHKQRSWDADGPGGCVRLLVQNFTGGYCAIQQYVDIYVISYKL